jgi:hypothetical protein
MKKILSIILSGLILVALLAGCASKPELAYVTGEDSEKITQTVNPIAENILTGIETNNYALFQNDFDETMKKALTEDAFAKIVKQYGTNGTHDSIELLNIEDQGTYYSVNYGVNYPDTKVIMSVVVSKANPDLVSGLWFK